MTRKITIKEIAREAGTSITVVSYVLNGTRNVSPELKNRVLEVIKKYNYKKDFSASALRGKITKLIGIIVHDFSNPLSAAIYSEIERMAHQQGYSVLICDSERKHNKELEYLDVLKSRNVDGVIMIPSYEDNAMYKRIFDYAIPAVTIERKLKNLDCVYCDYYEAASSVVNYLYGLGHRKIAYMNREPHLFISQERYSGYLQGLKNNSLELINELIIDGSGFNASDGYNEFEKIMGIKIKPTAVIAYNDFLAIGLIRACIDNNIKIPQEMSIIGFNNFPVDEYLYPRLSTVTLEKKKLAFNAFNLLIRRISNYEAGLKRIKIPVSIIARETT